MNNISQHQGSPRMAFIIGMGRSGTTLLTNMLNTRSDVVATPENEFLLFSYSSFKHADFTDAATAGSFLEIFNYDFNKVHSVWRPHAGVNSALTKSADFAEAVKQIYLSYPFAEKKSGVQLIVDKNPMYSLYLPMLKAVFPEARFIVLVRDYRDNILSRKKNSDANESLYDLAAAWNHYYEKIFGDINDLGLTYTVCRYEDLAASPESELKRLCDFLGLTYEPSMLEFQELSGRMQRHAEAAVPEAVARKIKKMHGNLEKKVNTERVSAFMRELTPKEILELDYFCEVHAKKFGYEPASNGTVSFISKVRYRMAVKKVRIFFAFQSLYYKVPVRLRLINLKRGSNTLSAD